MLKEEVQITAEDKQRVRVIMNALVHFGLIELSTQIHGLVERLIKA